ncbi:MAG: ArnT family glycosyltransferase [Rhodanobacteraceae bacterium]
MNKALTRRVRTPLIWVIVLGLLLGFSFQGTRALWRTDEGRYTDGALQMLDSGDWLVPAYSADRPNFSKPPLTYWAIAGSMKAFGRNTWAARTPYALAFLGTLLLLYAMGRVVTPLKPWLPSLVYGCMAMPFFSANVVSTDVLLTLCEALAMAGFLYAAFGEQDHRKRYLFVMWLGFGLAFLTKGPPGLVALLAILPFTYLRDGWRGLGRLFTVPGIAAFLVVGFGWYLAVVLRYSGVLHYFLHREIYDRLFTSEMRRHPGMWGWAVAYLPAFIVGSLPWWPALWRGLRAIVSNGTLRRLHRQRAPAYFLLLWLVLPLIVFCLSQSRLPLYVLPLFLPLALMLALMLRRRVALGSTRQRLLLGLWIAVLLAGKAVVAYAVHPLHDLHLAAGQLSALVSPHDYTRLVFVENTAHDYAIEEHTPWGLRLYVDRPVFGVAWQANHSTTALCRAVHNHTPALLAIDTSVPPKAVASALAACGVRQSATVGVWRKRALAMASE